MPNKTIEKYVFWQNWTSLARISRKVAPYFSSKQKTRSMQKTNLKIGIKAENT